MKIGFTGSRDMMSSYQIEQIKNLIVSNNPIEAHHGDCLGSDAMFHTICDTEGIEMHVHPPEKATYRAFCTGGILYPVKDYLVRNKDIVDACDLLIATPSGPEKMRSGTWSTIRYARRMGKPVIIIHTNGLIEREG